MALKKRGIGFRNGQEIQGSWNLEKKNPEIGLKIEDLRRKSGKPEETMSCICLLGQVIP
jgi:hypothetical protein